MICNACEYNHHGEVVATKTDAFDSVLPTVVLLQYIKL